MKLILTESLFEARKFAEALNSHSKKQGYFQGGEYLIAWIDDKTREIGDEPIVLIPFVFKNNHQNQFKIIKELMSQSEILIAANGAGFEDEKKFREVYLLINCELSFKRLWTNELTKKSILNALNNLWIEDRFQKHFVENKTKDISQLESDLYYLICNEYFNNKREPEKEFKIELEFKKDLIIVKCRSKQQWQGEESAKEVLQTLLRRKKLTIESLTHKTNAIEPPLLFNLNELLILCNEELGLSSFEIINILNSLYLRGFISYPFTTGNKISSNRWKQIPEILRSLQYKDSFADYFENLPWGKFNKNIIDAETALFQGIIPTNKVPSFLDRKEQAIYNRIAVRLIKSVSPSFNYGSLSLDLSALNYLFKGEILLLKESGWQDFTSIHQTNQVTFANHLPLINKGENLLITSARIIETTPGKELIKEAKLLDKFKTENPIQVASALKILEEKKLIKKTLGQFFPNFI